MIGENKLKKRTMKTGMIENSLIGSGMSRRKVGEDCARLSNADRVIALRQSAHDWISPCAHNLEQDMAKGMNQLNVLSCGTEYIKR